MNPLRVLIVDDTDMFIEPVDVMALAAEVRFWLEGPPEASARRFVWP